VYSPHTAVDAVPGGMADWLCDIVSGSVSGPSASLQNDLQNQTRQSDPTSSYSDLIYPQPGHNEIHTTNIIPHTRSAVHPSPDPVPSGFEGAGAGRILTFTNPQPLATLLDRIGRATGNPGSLSVAIPQDASISSLHITTVGVCPGSGGGVLMKGSVLPDLLFTGELSHHEALAAIERGSVVVTLFHSNTERGYLHDVMRWKLADALKQDGQVAVSKADRDPYGIVVRK
jgi:putative NIF3 family GTP cyclohydrolase 1 type 2